jgi:hypothetical protein
MRSRCPLLAASVAILITSGAWAAPGTASAPGRHDDVRLSLNPGLLATMGPGHAFVTNAPRPQVPRATATARVPNSSLVMAQASPPAMLPSLVLPPAATNEPPLFASLMQTGDAAMVRGDIARARTFYERAVAAAPASAAACLAAGKTYDPNILPIFGDSSGSFADIARASEWYERARALGAPEAAALLASLRQ